MSPLLLFWPAFVALLAFAQGLLMPAIRRTPPSSEARRQSLALHGLLTAAYLLPLVLVSPWRLHLVAAAISRALLFDVLLNAGAGAPLFAVGQTAYFDKGLQHLAAGLHIAADRLRFGLWAVSLLGSGGALWYFKG